MNISKKLKQLMKVLLVVFMSLTMIVPNGLVKAENQYLHTDKTVYKYGEPIMVGVTGYDYSSSYVWVGLYKVGDPYQDGSSTRWFQVTDELSWNILDYNKNKTVDENGAEYEVVLFGDGGYSQVIEKQPVTILPNVDNDYLFTDHLTYVYGDPIIVTVKDYTFTSADSYVWVGLYEEDAPYADGYSTSWYRIYDNDTRNILDGTVATVNSAIPITGGNYKVTLFNGDGSYSNVLEEIHIVIEPTAEESSLAFNMDLALDDPEISTKYSRIFRYDEFEIIASSPNPSAWVGMVKRYDTNDHYTNWYNVADHKGEPFNIILDGSTHNGYPVVAADTTLAELDDFLTEESPGRYNVVLFKDGGYDNDKVLSVILLKVYDVTNWKFEDDFSKATATFESTDDGTRKTLETTNITSEVTTAPKCEEDGERTYTATLDIAGAFETVTKENVFTGTKTSVEPATGHDWGEWEVITPATEETEGLERRVCKNDPAHTEDRIIPKLNHVHTPTAVAAKDPTCTEDGNIAYYVCEGCGKYFADEACTEELNAEELVIKATGHSYGSWTFDEVNHNHYKECSVCHDKIVEECDFEDTIDGGTVIHNCSVCKGSYEDKFFWTDKTEYKQFEPIICHVDLSVISGYAGLNTNTAWVGMYGAGTAPAADISIRWHYVKNMGTPEEGLDMLTKIYGDEEGGSGTTNGYDWLLNQAGNLELYLLADGGYDKRVAHLTITLTEETLACGDIAFEFDGKDPAEEEKFEYTVPLEKTIQFKATVDGDPYGSWFGIYEGEYEKDYNFSSLTANKFWYLRDVDGAVSVNDYINKPGKYTMVVYATGGYEDMREFFWVEVTKEIAKEEVTIEPTCTEAGSKLVTYTDGTTENVPIPALGHDWGEWVYDGEEAKTHTRTCKNDPSHTETVNCEFDEGVVDGDVTTYTCKECGGQYTYTRVASDAPLFRASGDNRYLTALTAADVFMEKTHKSELDTVVLACGSNFADALAGSYLAAVKNAPIILIDDNNKAATVEKYLKEHVAKGGLIYILGGDKAVAPKFESSLKKAGFTVKRLAGSNRYGTNLEILKEAGIQGNAILVSTGTNFADSLSASASGLPVLLVKDKLTAEQKDFLSNYNDKKIYILGGTNAVNKTVEGELGEYGTIKRLNGANRYETSVKIAEEFLKDADTLVIAVGDNFPDGLCGGALAYQIGAPVILVKDGRADYAKKLVEKKHIEKGVVLGGTNALKDTLINEIFGRDPKTPVEVYVKK